MTGDEFEAVIRATQETERRKREAKEDREFEANFARGYDFGF